MQRKLYKEKQLQKKKERMDNIIGCVAMIAIAGALLLIANIIY